MEIVLGSKSARRKELLELMGYDFSVDYVDIDEVVNNYKTPVEYAKKVVTKKGNLISKKYKDKLVICADTIVVLGNEIINKPVDINDARDMISSLSNKEHKVITAVYLKYKDYKKVFYEVTKVYFDKLSNKEIEDYINTKEPYDKSGGYGIQGIFGKHIKKINGDFYNVMGLPINRLYEEIKKIKSI